MKVSKEQLAENRRKILESAARLFRERGFDAVTLDDVMNDAGLTRGAFYGHFKSKDDLVEKAIAVAAQPPETLATIQFSAYVNGYLSAFHRDNHAEGCAFAALASEVVRQPAPTRHEMTEGFKQRVELMSSALPGATADERRRAAIASLSSMMGALILARMSDDAVFSQELLTVNIETLTQTTSAA